jgi:hypothetical protein
MTTVSQPTITAATDREASRWLTSLGAPCSEVVDLLSAIRDALDVPLPGLRPEDESAYYRLMEQRVNAVRCTLQGLLAYPGRLTPDSAEYIRASAALSPVTYATYVPEGRLCPA